jgi:hypothetical protein
MKNTGETPVVRKIVYRSAETVAIDAFLSARLRPMLRRRMTGFLFELAGKEIDVFVA